MKKATSNKDYDLNYVKAFGEDDSFLLMLINVFISSSKEDLELFKKAMEADNWGEMGNLAHKMRSRSQHFKMTKLDGMLPEIEKQCTETKFKANYKAFSLNMITYYFEIIDLLTQESVILNNSKE